MIAFGLMSAPVVHAEDADRIERGRYLVVIGGCNDCHTPGYAPTGGAVPESGWLTGDRVGFNGPWGTSYPTNLRIYFSQLDESQWLSAARHLQSRPPMPGFALKKWTDEDLGALYAFINNLGPAGEAAPAALPPGQDPGPIVVRFPAAP